MQQELSEPSSEFTSSLPQGSTESTEHILLENLTASDSYAAGAAPSNSYCVATSFSEGVPTLYSTDFNGTGSAWLSTSVSEPGAMGNPGEVRGNETGEEVPESRVDRLARLQDRTEGCARS